MMAERTRHEHHAINAHTELLFLTMYAHQETHTPIEVGDSWFI